MVSFCFAAKSTNPISQTPSFLVSMIGQRGKLVVPTSVPVERLVPGHGHPVEGTPDPRRRFQQLFGVLQHVSVGQHLQSKDK